MSFNQLTGSVPNFNNLPSLEHISFEKNQLSGSLPDFTNLPNLRLITGYENQLTGPTPTFNSTPLLSVVYLNDNQLTGTFPSFSNHPYLNTLRLQHNQITGALPSFNDKPYLEYLFLYDNQLTGSVPSFDSLPMLRYVYLYDNQLTGGVPKSRKLPALERFILDDNQLDGTLEGFEEMTPRFVFSVRGNALTFEDIIGNLDSISANAFFGFGDQDSIGTTDTIVLMQGDHYTIDLQIDDTVTTNTYYWYKDTVLIDSTFGVNEYTISNFQATDAGTYNARVVNSIFTNLYQNYALQLYSRPVTLVDGSPIAIAQRASPSFTLYPNPIKDIFYVDIESTSELVELTVLDVQGRILQQQQTKGQQRLAISLAAQPAGVYFLRLKQGDQVWQEKLLKQ